MMKYIKHILWTLYQLLFIGVTIGSAIVGVVILLTEVFGNH